MDAVAQTARAMAALRARESARADRLFGDPLAYALAGEEAVAELAAAPPAERDNPYVVIRTRVFDEWLERATVGDGVRQVVLVAAGMDSRAFRLAWPDGVTLWELDQPALLEVKERVLASAGVVPRCDRRTVGVDLERADWPERLRDAGFQPAAPSAWLAEGFFAYLEDAAVERSLTAIATLAAPGSLLGADFVSQSLFSSPWMAPYLRKLAQRGTPWRFGTDRPATLLARCGWRAQTVRQPGQKDANFGRWPWPAALRWVPGAPRLFFVTAQRPD